MTVWTRRYLAVLPEIPQGVEYGTEARAREVVKARGAGCVRIEEYRRDQAGAWRWMAQGEAQEAARAPEGPNIPPDPPAPATPRPAATPRASRAGPSHPKQIPPELPPEVTFRRGIAGDLFDTQQSLF